ncbi:GAF and ANTAR domain-containing protein [Nonomuraea sp. NPDC048892]|uniref:GAF and ANTAR domain-containing protein n=1 Tax=Nonomuraea TaxID=83681 RepID=UPI0033D24748
MGPTGEPFNNDPADPDAANQATPDPDGLPEGYLHELAGVLLATSPIDAALNELAVAASRITPGAPMAGVTLRLEGRVSTVASSEAHALRVDEIQYDNGPDGGPCLQAIDTGQIVIAGDLATEPRWGAYPAHLLAHGLRSVFSHPLNTGEKVIGALNMYATTPAETAFTPPARHAIARVATHTGLLLHAVLQAARHTQVTNQFRQALTQRAIIEQAVGILMGQRRCTAPDAFAIMRQASQSRNRRLRDIATDIIESFTGQPPARPSPFIDPP